MALIFHSSLALLGLQFISLRAAVAILAIVSSWQNFNSWCYLKTVVKLSVFRFFGGWGEDTSDCQIQEFFN
jgi:hypothetical protein